jgi:Bor protein
MKMPRAILLPLLIVAVSGCYAARIETGLPPSSTKITQKFASCWVYGLVPPKTVKTATECPNGVAIVETRHSFLNQVVGSLTFGIYTPMEIVVTCAEKSSASLIRSDVNLEIAEGASTEEYQRVFAQAADAAVETGRPVCVMTAP